MNANTLEKKFLLRYAHTTAVCPIIIWILKAWINADSCYKMSVWVGVSNKIDELSHITKLTSMINQRKKRHKKIRQNIWFETAKIKRWNNTMVVGNLESRWISISKAMENFSKRISFRKARKAKEEKNQYYYVEIACSNWDTNKNLCMHTIYIIYMKCEEP